MTARRKSKPVRKPRPPSRLKFMPEDIQMLQHRLRSITEPARRHKCPLCESVFECHLCAIAEDHWLHRYCPGGKVLSKFICEDCVYKHELFVAVVNAEDHPSRHSKDHAVLGNRLSFYDHITGECIGHGTYRMNCGSMLYRNPVQDRWKWLSAGDVRKIKQMLRRGWTPMQIARKGLCSERAARRIRDGESYREVK